MKKKSLRKKSYLLPSLVGIGGLVALSATSIFTLVPQIQNSLAEQVKEVLSQANIGADIIVSGRDITLSGIMVNPETRLLAYQKVMNAQGVRKVTNNLGQSSKKTSLPNMSASTYVTSIPAIEIETPLDKRLTDPIDDSDLGEKPELDTISGLGDDNDDILPLEGIDDPEQAIEEPSKETIAEKTMIKVPPAPIERTILAQVSKPKAKSNVLDYETLLAAMNSSKRSRSLSAKAAKEKAKTTTPVKKQTQAIADTGPLNLDIDMSQILFQKDKRKLHSSSQTPLNRLARKFQNSSGKIKIIVTEQDSSTAFKQAKVIRSYLTNLGIKKRRMTIVGRENKNSKVEIYASN